ncbi:MAG: dihydrodipicolinate synthase family protein [Methanoregulaceae archaeon]|nr:dihydrodipicolinate synthase family protein [Methanoregulaceae archaeon]
MRNLVGLFAPLPTPFTDDTSSISEVRLGRLIRHFLDEGVQGFVVGSTVGEFSTLSLAERKHMLELTVRMAEGHPVIVHATCFATSLTLDLAQHAARSGANLLIVSPPPFGEFTDDEVYQFIAFVAHHASLPVAVVDPTRRITAALRERLDALPTVMQTASVSGIAAFYPEGTHSDQFALNEARISPIVTLAPWRLYPDALAHWLPEPLRHAGSARVVKAALELQGFECGPLRGPLASLQDSLRGALTDFALNHSDAA